MARAVPTINTARITLRAMRAEDFDTFAKIWALPDVVRHIAGEPRTRAQSWDAFLRNAGHWQIKGFGQWGIEIRGAAGLAGQVGFFFGSRGLGEDFDRHAEAGWVLDPSWHGQGLGRDAVLAAHDWYDRVIATPTVCIIAPENLPSLRIARQLGYEELRKAELGGDAVLLMRRKGPPV